MALNASGPISLAGTTAGQSIEIENGGNGTTQISLNDTAVRTLAGVPSGAITMPTNFWGKSNVVNLSYTYSANTANAALNLSTLPGYSAGKTNFTVTVNAGVYVYSTSTANYALNISGGTTGDTLTIVNNGYIMGMGGAGGSSWVPGPGNPTAGSAGGPAINFGFGMASATVTNSSGYIGGGGGGGGSWDTQGGGGGGAGGASGGPTGASSMSPGAAGGGVGAAGSDSPIITVPYGKFSATQTGGAGGGRILPGTGGTGGQVSSPSRGGGAGGGGGSNSQAANGGPGGSAGAAGAGGGSSYAGGGGGGWGASGGNGLSRGGGAGGKAINLNAKTITWTGGTASSSRAYGAVS